MSRSSLAAALANTPCPEVGRVSRMHWVPRGLLSAMCLANSRTITGRQWIGSASASPLAGLAIAVNKRLPSPCHQSPCHQSCGKETIPTRRGLVPGRFRHRALGLSTSMVCRPRPSWKQFAAAYSGVVHWATPIGSKRPSSALDWSLRCGTAAAPRNRYPKLSGYMRLSPLHFRSCS